MILVTGGLGFIGSNFVNLWLDGKLPIIDTSEVTILDKLTYASDAINLAKFRSDARVNVIIGDVCDERKVNELVEKSNGIIHFAAESHVDNSISSPREFINTNIVGTFNLLQSAAKYGKRIIYVSTDEVYGSISAGEATEESKLNPSSPYSASKAAGDLLALSFFQTFNTDVIITRCVNNFGTHQNEEKLIPTIVSSILKGKKIPIYGSGTNIRNWIDVEDHSRGIASCFVRGESGEIYNFGTQEYLSNLEVCRLFLNYAGASESQIAFVKDRKGHDFRYAVNSAKSREKLDWKPRYSLTQKAGEIFEWYAKNLGAKIN